MIQIITAVERDGLDERILTLVFEIPSPDFDLKAAIRATVMDFLRTDEGKEVAHETAALLHMKVNAVNDAARRIRKKALGISRRLLECFLLAWFL